MKASKKSTMTPEACQAFRNKVNAQRRQRYAEDPEFRAKCYERSRKWRETHREQYNEYHRKYGAKLREEAKARSEVDSKKEAKRKYRREWYQKNKEDLKQYYAEYRAKNPEKVKAWQENYLKRHPEKVSKLREIRKVNSKKWHEANRDYHNMFKRIAKRRRNAVANNDFIAAREYDTALRVLSDDLAKMHGRRQFLIDR